MSKRLFIIFSASLILLFLLDMAIGSVNIPLADVCNALLGRSSSATISSIVIDIRLIKAVVAMLVGAALSASGLQMQTLFRNPLAGPYVLGLSSGASLGVALFILGAPFLAIPAALNYLGVAGAAWIGSAAILIVMGVVGSRIKDIMVVLILGMMFSSGVSAIVQILQYVSREDALKSFVTWTMGSLGDVTASQLKIFVPAVIIGLAIALLTVKQLNLLLLGEEYAVSMGLDIKRSRSLIFLSTTLLAGTSTAFCGPIGFIGLAMPHVARLIFRESNHNVLMPASILVGACVMLCCDIVSKFFAVPINAITSLVGIPVVVIVVIKNMRHG